MILEVCTHAWQMAHYRNLVRIQQSDVTNTLNLTQVWTTNCCGAESDFTDCPNFTREAFMNELNTKARLLAQT
ncbi:hypothetical protein HX867_19865 [Pseudomonas gingeri]|uniref:hypothetical protein n=1 Tax=Pseudomonas gingeri TaxID=117681 RepID=UPI0015A151A3|nr:hypothetical protein [Pseudomonas gingeri]NVZ64362.1 hypothetical protein [Pseudomonas gingeri]NVZ75955.1 hypothetical protein [Pseudomonas gingeri]